MNSKKTPADFIKSISEDPEMIRVAHAAIQNTLVEFRDSHISLLGRGNGLCIRPRDSKGRTDDPFIIRLGPEDAMRIGLDAIAEHLKGVEDEQTNNA